MYRYALAYKPYGIISVERDDRRGRDTLTAMGIPASLRIAGRLDMDSEGLLLLTDDGQTLHRLTHPHFSHTKTYFVLVLGEPDVAALTTLREGVDIKLGKTRPADVERLGGSPPLPEPSYPLPHPSKTSWLRMVLQEGMNRQIKRMTAAVGHPTVRLVRVAIGRLTLPADLKPGEWRDLNAVERQVLLTDIWPHGRPRSTMRPPNTP
jgi:23S rRNA pseudouridine2457 synthase